MAARTFNDLSDGELGRLTRSRYDRLSAAHDAGLSDTHPSDQWAKDTEVLKAYRDAKAADQNFGLGPVELQNKNKAKDRKRGKDEEVDGMDDEDDEGGSKDEEVDGMDNPLKITGGVSTSRPAQDAALDAARRVNPTRVSNMAAAIPGYTRLNRR